MIIAFGCRIRPLDGFAKQELVNAIIEQAAAYEIEAAVIMRDDLMSVTLAGRDQMGLLTFETAVRSWVAQTGGEDESDRT